MEIKDDENTPFIIMQARPPHTDERTKHIIAIMTASEKNILNTSIPLAPTARRMPISLRLDDMDVEMKLNSMSAENTAMTSPMIRNTIVSVSNILDMLSAC